MAKLTARWVEGIKVPGRYGDGGGLWLQVTPTGTKSWLLRYMLNGRSRSMGLGPLDLISLAEARERARSARRRLLDKIDPIEARQGERAQRRLDEARALTFQQCGESYIAAHESGWRGAGKSAEQWRASLATYAYPTLGLLPVAAIDAGLVLRVLEPIWTAKRETASRVRGRIEGILDWATVRGYRKGENPARWKGHLDKLLPGKAPAIRHLPALPYAELPGFMAELRIEPHGSIAALALELLILTASRSSEITGATWSEINFETKTWSISGNRMKAGKEHRVPLSDRAIQILKAMPTRDGNVFILSRKSMLNLIHELRPGYTIHGFRSSFRDWAAEKTNFQSQVIEMALAHTVGNKVEAAYRRGDLFDKRRELMNEWCNFLK
jgi:integrase